MKPLYYSKALERFTLIVNTDDLKHHYHFDSFSEALEIALVFASKGCEIDIISAMTGEVLFSLSQSNVPYVSSDVQYIG